MAVRIRMKRLGRRKRPFYRLVAIDSKTRREGTEVERLGWYDPLNKDNHFSINEDRVKHWLGVGAKASYAAKGLFKKAGLSYKWHLEKNGATEEEVVRLVEEWHSRKSLKIEKSKEIPVIEDPVEEETEATVVSAESGDEESQEKVETLEETASESVDDSPKEETKDDSSEEKSEEKLEATETVKEKSE